MSDDQQMASLGRLAAERGEVRKQRALRGNDVEATAAQLFQLATRLKSKDFESQKLGLQLLREMVAAGTWDRLEEEVSDLIGLTERLVDLDQKAHDAGI
jgi:hypothetical protein